MRAKEVAGVVARIREAIDYYGPTAKDLGFGGVSGSRGAAKGTQRNTLGKVGARKRVRPTVVKIRFQDEHGNAWSGRGRRPQWYKDAIAAGKKPEELAV